MPDVPDNSLKKICFQKKMFSKRCLNKQCFYILRCLKCLYTCFSRKNNLWKKFCSLIAWTLFGIFKASLSVTSAYTRIMYTLSPMRRYYGYFSQPSHGITVPVTWAHRTLFTQHIHVHICAENQLCNMNLFCWWQIWSVKTDFYMLYCDTGIVFILCT